MKRNLKKACEVFSRAVHERFVKNDQRTLAECAIEEADEFGIDYEEIPNYLTPELVSMFHIEASNLRLLKLEERVTETIGEFFDNK